MASIPVEVPDWLGSCSITTWPTLAISMSSIFNIQDHVIPASHMREYARATCDAQHAKLLLHVREYIPKDNPVPQKGDITIIGGHANGFPKVSTVESVKCPVQANHGVQEVYEPLWEDLYVEAKSRGIRIRSILMADAAWQGQSGILNSNALGNDRKKPTPP